LQRGAETKALDKDRSASELQTIIRASMEIRLEEFNNSHADFLVLFLTGEQWPFHSGTGLAEDEVRERIQSGFYTKPGVKTFIVFDESNERIGYVRLFDLGSDLKDSETPLFDIRFRESERGRGRGKATVKALVDYVFTTYPNKNRFEATTRHDNIAMRKVLKRCGFVKEAHYRRAWPDKSGTPVDCVGYGILRSDWETGTTTPVPWQDDEGHI